MSHSECQILFEAGRALVEKSGLAHYRGQHFVPSDDKVGFDTYWKEEFHPEFGRYMAWVLLSVGAENLAKAACVCSGTVKVVHRPRLEHYIKRHFSQLCRGTAFYGTDDERTLTEGYKNLTEVRNRDAHSYRKDVRDADFLLVEEAFVPAFDILMKAMGHWGHPPAKFQAETP